jgi:hypothetical protein
VFGADVEVDHAMRSVVRNILCLCLWLAPISTVSAGDRVPIGNILKHPADYQAKVVTVEGRARAVSNFPVHRGTPRCGGSEVYDSQTFALKDESGTIGIGTTGTCRPNATELVLESEHLRIRGVVVADKKDPKAPPVIYADTIDRVTP